MQRAWHRFLDPPTHFRLRDVINVIFGKTAITPSLAKLKTSRKKLKLSRTSYRFSQILKSAYFCAGIAKKALNMVTMVTKIMTCYISVMVPDRPIVTIIHR